MSARRASAFLAAAAAACCLRESGASGAAGDARAVERAGRGRVGLPEEHDATARGGPGLPAEPEATRWSNSSLLEDLGRLQADRRLAKFAQDMPRRLQTVIGALRVLTGDAPGALKPPQDDALVRSLEKRAAVTPRLQPTLLQSEAEDAGVRERSRADDAARFAVALEKGLAAVGEAVKHFVAKPPGVEVGVGVDKLGRGLLEAIKAYAKFNDSASFESFERNWMRVCDKTAAKLPIFLKNIHKFQETGTYDYVITAVSDILDLLSEGIAKFAPHGIAMEVVKYIGAVEKMLDVIGDSWTADEPGKEAEAAKVFYDGTRDVLDMVLTDDVKNNMVYETIVGTLDNVMGGLTETVAEFRKQIITSNVCWKQQFVTRENYAPTECPDGYWPDDERYCLPMSSLLETNASLLETSVARKFWKSKPEGALPARCKEGSEKLGSRCFSLCPANMEPMESMRKKCETKCAFEFHHDDGGLLCGRSPVALKEATARMLWQASIGAIVTTAHVAVMVNTGAVTAASLTGTVNGLEIMAKPFFLPSCPK